MLELYGIIYSKTWFKYTRGNKTLVSKVVYKGKVEGSGGEKSRAVFARGIIMKPQIILSDESTASLVVENREQIINSLFKMNEEFNTTSITVTHDLEVANRHDRVIHIERRK